MKTAGGRLSYRFPLAGGLELGASGAIGAQDNQPDSAVVQWHDGFDAQFEGGNVVAAAEFVLGRAPGSTEPGRAACDVAPCLSYRGAYGQLGYRVANWLTPYARVDWRDALHRNGASFVYL